MAGSSGAEFLSRTSSRCTNCGFLLAPTSVQCPMCNTSVRRSGPTKAPKPEPRPVPSSMPLETLPGMTPAPVKGSGLLGPDGTPRPMPRPARPSARRERPPLIGLLIVVLLAALVGLVAYRTFTGDAEVAAPTTSAEAEAPGTARRAQGADWTDYRDPAGRFSVGLPAGAMPAPMSASIGALPVNGVSANLGDGVTAAVVFHQLPADPAPGEGDEAAVLNDALDRSGLASGEVRNRADGTAASGPSLDVEAVHADGTTHRAHLVLADRVVFMVHTSSAGDDGTAALTHAAIADSLRATP